LYVKKSFRAMRGNAGEMQLQAECISGASYQGNAAISSQPAPFAWKSSTYFSSRTSIFSERSV
jgi:hypothetical protein